MAIAQRLVISVLLILTVIFAFLAQGIEATKGPKITNKVRGIDPRAPHKIFTNELGVFRYRA
jgi:hypothetical protein